MLDHLREFGRPLVGSALQDATRGALRGLHHMHRQTPALVHGDIRCANLLIELSDNKMVVKLTDFCRTMSISQACEISSSGSIPWPWTAPEAMIGQEVHVGADIWSFGCTVLEMATGEHPWASRDFKTLIDAIAHVSQPDVLPPLPSHLSQTCRDFVVKCLRRDPDERLGTEALLDHSFAIEWELA